MGMLVPMATAQDLSATIKHEGEWIPRFHPLEFTLSRPLSAGERLELVVGTTDVSDLCVVHGDTLLYQPQVVPLPSGPLSITLSVITPEGTWNSAGTFSLNVLTVGALENAAIAPSVSIANKGQPAEDHFPDGTGGGRKSFQELNGQLGMKMVAGRGGFQAGLTFSLIGVSYRQEAIRFSEKREDAAKVDLSSYLLEARTGRTALSLGHFSLGRERHLLNGFVSRGVSASTALGTFADFSAAVVNGTNIVGWDNLTGLDNPNHRVYSGTLGLEILPSTPGVVRVEASYVHGSQLPISNFNQGQITDAEKSEGGAIRLQLADPGRSITLDAGIAKTRFTNPQIPFASQAFDVVPTQPTTRLARYADVSWDIFRNEMLLGALPARLNLGFRHEHVDPLYRAVGASVRSDILQNAYEAHGGIGPVQVDMTHLRSEDNLADLPSVLKSKTRQTGATALFSPLAMPGELPFWLPMLSYGVNSTHQFGVSTPINSDFTPTRVPDQVTTSQTAGIEWQITNLRVGYRGTYTLQDNRQTGRENADAVNRTHGVSLSVTPFPQLVMTAEGSLESLESLETSTIVRTRRIGLGLSALLLPGTSTNVTGSLSTTKNDDGSSSQRQASFSFETSYSFDLSRSFIFNWRGQLFVRYAWNEGLSRNLLFDQRSMTRAWVITTGISFNLF
jgi:hypothetical protein